VRPGLDLYLMSLAAVAATRTTCIKRMVGCVLADARGRVLSVAYNGVVSGQPHCNAVTRAYTTPGPCGDAYVEERGHACAGYSLPSGQDACEAVHAEQNAILQCGRPDDIHGAYVTLSPCRACAKLLINTACRRLVFGELHDRAAVDLWLGSNQANQAYWLTPDGLVPYSPASRKEEPEK
jgi:dCMP deaminase